MKKLILFFGIVFLYCAISSAQNDITGELKTGYIDIGKAKIYYEEKGSGIPFIMIHGGFLDRRMWDNQFEYFSKNYRVIRYDVRNHGATTSDSDSYYDYEDLNNIMEKLKIDKAIVMGLSMGGYITLDFALTHPEKLIAILPVATGLSGYVPKDKEWEEFYKNLNKAFEKDDLDLAAEYMLRAWTDGPKRKPEQVDKTIRDKLKEMIVGTFSKWKSEVKPGKLKPPAIERLSEIKIPTLTVYGDLDMPGIIEIAEKIEKEVSGSKKYMIQNTAHMVNMEFSDEFNEIVNNFLENLKYHLTTEQAGKMIRDNAGNSEFVLMDVRTPEEFSTGYIKGATNIDIKSGDFLEKLEGLNKEKTYLIYCRSGVRSAKTLEVMQKKGFSKVYNLLGGIKKWKEENRLIENK